MAEKRLLLGGDALSGRQETADALYELPRVTSKQVRCWPNVPDDVSISDVWMIGEGQVPYLGDRMPDGIDVKRYVYDICEYAEYD